MSIINRYILRQLLVNFAILMVVAQALFVSIDLIVNLDYYMDAAKAIAARENAVVAFAFVRVVVDFYMPMCLLMYVYLSGIIVVAAMGFTVVSLQRTRELTAVVASGVSLRRVAMLLAAASCALNLLAAPVQEWVLPPLAYNALRSRKDLVHENSASRDPVQFMPVNKRGDLLSAEFFDMKAGVLEGFRLMERDEDGNRLDDIKAAKARWNGAQGAWVFEPAARCTAPSRGGLAPPEVKSVAQWKTDVSPKVIHACQDGNYARLLSLGDMDALAQTPTLAPEFRDGLRQAWWARLAMPLFSTLLTLVTIPFFLSRIPVIAPKQGVLAAGLCLGCWAVGLLLMSASALPPVVAAWLPVGLLAALAWWRIRAIET